MLLNGCNALQQPKNQMFMLNRLVLLSAIMVKAHPSWAMPKQHISSLKSECAHKKVLVTGASGVLGTTMVEKFLSEGFEVIGTRSPSSSSNPEKKILGIDNPKLRWHTVDVTRPSSVKAMADEVGPVDVLVHCAGGFRFAKSEDLLDDDIEFLINTNLKSAMYLIREFIPPMKSRNFGRIILIGSKSTSQPGAGEHM